MDLSFILIFLLWIQAKAETVKVEHSTSYSSCRNHRSWAQNKLSMRREPKSEEQWEKGRWIDKVKLEASTPLPLTEKKKEHDKKNMVSFFVALSDRTAQKMIRFIL